MKPIKAFFALLTISALGIGSIALAEVKLGYVDAERVFKESKMGMEALKALQELEDQKKGELNSLVGEIDRMEKELSVQSSILSEDARLDRTESIRRAKIDYKRTAEDAERELRRLEKTYLEKIDQEVMEILNKLGKSEGYTMIVGNVASGVLYVSPSIDLTDMVIAAYNKSAG